MGSSRQGWKLPSPPAPLPKRARGEIALSRDHDHECTVPDMVPGEGSNRCSETPKTLNNVRLSANVFRRHKVREFLGECRPGRAACERSFQNSAMLNCTKGPAQTYYYVWIVTTNNVWIR